MQIIKSLVERTLEQEPNFRERSRRYKGFHILLIEEYPSLCLANPQQLIDYALDFGTMTRTWNKVLEEREDLRGSDYNDKVELEKRAIKQLNPTHHE